MMSETMSEETKSGEATAGTATLGDVQRVMELAQLELSAAEQERMLKDLNAILKHVAELGEVDTSAVEPMAAGIPVLDQIAENSKADSRATLREDKRRPSLERKVVMAEAPETDGVFFKVPKVIER
jgi:aspartyl-tRNA(Asn)/glutamyl-tRNA(Gln) amidotransferase subunit C